jgi:serine/threonine protein kinase
MNNHCQRLVNHFRSSRNCQFHLPAGNTLYTHLHLRKDKFSMNKIVIIAQQIAQGMGYLHHRGIIHKDLKTKNIFLENGRAIITDFGLVNVARRLCARQVGPEFYPKSFAALTERLVQNQRQSTLDCHYLTLLCDNLKKRMFLQNLSAFRDVKEILSSYPHNSTILQPNNFIRDCKI